MSLLPGPGGLSLAPPGLAAHRAAKARRAVLPRLGGQHLQGPRRRRLHVLLRAALQTPGGPARARQARTPEGAAQAGPEGRGAGAEAEQRRAREEVREGRREGGAAAAVAEVEESGDAGQGGEWEFDAGHQVGSFLHVQSGYNDHASGCYSRQSLYAILCEF